MIEENDAKDDFEYSRSTYYELLDKGREGLDLMMEVARESEHPRAFEVVSQLMKTMIDANKDFISLQKQVKDIREDKSKPPTPQNVTNAMFVGNTKDLQKMLKEM